MQLFLARYDLFKILCFVGRLVRQRPGAEDVRIKVRKSFFDVIRHTSEEELGRRVWLGWLLRLHNGLGLLSHGKVFRRHSAWRVHFVTTEGRFRLDPGLAHGERPK